MRCLGLPCAREMAVSAPTPPWLAPVMRTLNFISYWFYHLGVESDAKAFKWSLPVFPSTLFGKVWTTSNPVEKNENWVMVRKFSIYIYICICNTNEYPEVHWGGSKLGIYTTFPRTCFERDYKERQTYAERPFPVSVLHIKRMLGWLKGSSPRFSKTLLKYDRLLAKMEVSGPLFQIRSSVPLFLRLSFFSAVSKLQYMEPSQSRKSAALCRPSECRHQIQTWSS